MSTIASINENHHGNAHDWRVVPALRHPHTAVELVHAGTGMLVWNPDHPADESLLDFSVGRGSVSDQSGTNTAFKVFGLPYTYARDRRAGGPRISMLPTVELGTLRADGSLTDEREIAHVRIRACPNTIMVSEHYAPSGPCRCYNTDAHELADCGYVWTGFRWTGLRRKMVKCVTGRRS